MTITEQILDQLAALAYLDSGQDQAKSLAHEVNTIIDFVEQLMYHKYLYNPLKTGQGPGHH